jgi:hypothetical protein
MPNQGSQINGERLLTHLAEKLCYVRRRTTTVSGDQSGHTHSHEVLSGGQVVNGLNVSVNIDEARSDYLICRINYANPGNRINGANPRYSPILDSNVTAKPGIARPINNAAVPDYEIIWLTIRFFCDCQMSQPSKSQRDRQ